MYRIHRTQNAGTHDGIPARRATGRIMKGRWRNADGLSIAQAKSAKKGYGSCLTKRALMA